MPAVRLEGATNRRRGTSRLIGICGNAKFPDRVEPGRDHGHEIDGRSRRGCRANFSVSGLKHQDNDLNVIESAEAAAALKRTFDPCAHFSGCARCPAFCNA